MKTIFGTLLFLIPMLSSYPLFAEGCLPDTVYLVRHTEKQKIPGERDPDLSKKGVERAKSLAQALKDTTVNKVFASQYKRTQQTVAPTSKIKKLEVIVRDAKAVKDLSDEIMSSCNETILVAGHSNTVPQLLKSLGLKFEVTVAGKNLRFEPVIYLNDKEDYGSLFKVTFSKDGSPELELSAF